MNEQLLIGTYPKIGRTGVSGHLQVLITALTSLVSPFYRDLGAPLV